MTIPKSSATIVAQVKGGQDWTKAYGVVRDFRWSLEGLKEYDVSFRVPEPEQYMVRSAHRSTYAGA